MKAVRRVPPIPDELTQPFWDAAKEGLLKIQRCQSCRMYCHPPVRECGSCSSETLAFEQVSGRGTLYSYTIIHTSRVKGFDGLTPYPVAFIELEEQPGLILCGNMPETAVDELQIGVSTEVFFVDIEGGFKLPDFYIAER